MKYTIYLILLFSAYSCCAQTEEILRFLPQVQQSMWSTPTNRNDSKVSVSLPLASQVNLGVFNSGFLLSDLYTLRGDTAVISLGNTIDNLRDDNLIGVNLNYGILSAHVNKKGTGVGFSVNDRLSVKLIYPGALAKFIKDGNGATMGVPQNVGGFKFHMNYYRECALHLQQEVGKFTFAVSPKLLFGQANIYTRRSELSILTDTSYFKITGTSELDISAAGLDTSLLTSNLNANGIASTLFNKQNMGFGINIGASYLLSSRITVAAGINDLGSIKWRDNVINLKSDKAQVSFEGIDLAQLTSTTDGGYVKVLDSLKNFFKLTEVNNLAYRTPLATQFYALGSYQLRRAHGFGASLVVGSFNKKAMPSFTASYQFTPSRNFMFAASYTAKRFAPANLGAAVVLRGIGTQWFFATDNILSAFTPLSSRSSSFTLGMNLVFGKHRTLAQRKYPDIGVISEYDDSGRLKKE
ncbi:MAG: hypothetical protein RL660_1295 [Bacteroidota bacterium]|jgi:hypothetical protein